MHQRGATATQGVSESNLAHKHDVDVLVDGNRDIALGGGVTQVCWQRLAGPPFQRVAVAERRRGLAPIRHKHWRCLQAQPAPLFRRECACACAVRASVRRERGVHRPRRVTEVTPNKTEFRSTASSGEAKQGRRCCDPAAPTAPPVRLDLSCRPTCAHACGGQGSHTHTCMHSLRLNPRWPPRIEAQIASGRSRRSSDHQGQGIRGKMR